MLKETIMPVWDYVYETRKWKAKLAENICQIEIWNLSPMKHYIFSSKCTGPPAFWILPKLYDLCKYCRRNALETLEWTLNLNSICNFSGVSN